jgi:hypothetical protein
MSIVTMKTFSGDAEILGSVRAVEYDGAGLRVACSLEDAHKILSALSVGKLTAGSWAPDVPDVPDVPDERGVHRSPSSSSRKKVGSTLSAIQDAPATVPATNTFSVKTETLGDAVSGFVRTLSDAQARQDADPKTPVLPRESALDDPPVDAAGVPVPVREAKKISQVIQHCQVLGMKTAEEVLAACDRWRPHSRAIQVTMDGKDREAFADRIRRRLAMNGSPE